MNDLLERSSRRLSMIFGTAKRPSWASGAIASTSSRSRLDRTTSVRTTLTSPKGVRGRLDVLQIERTHVLGVLEDLAKLIGEPANSPSLSVSRANLATCATSSRRNAELMT